MPIKSASPVGVALAGAQKLFTSPTARKLIGEAAKAAGELGAQVAREQLPGLVRRISSGGAGPRGAGPRTAAPEPRSARGLVSSALASAAPELASLRAQARPLRQKALVDAGLGLQVALLAATQQRSASAGAQVLGGTLGTVGSQLYRDAQPIATQLVWSAATRLTAAATRQFAKTTADDASASPLRPDESASTPASSIAPAGAAPDAT